VYDRIAQRSAVEKKCVDCDNNLWVQYYNQHDKVFSSNNSPRFYNNTSGALVGYDRSLGDFLVGAYAGFGKSDLRQHDDSKMDVEDTTFGVYSGYTMGDWAFKGTLFAGTQNYHGKRHISFMNRTADGKYNGSNVGLDLEASYNIPVFNWLNVKPFAGWLNSYAHQQAFTEKDAGALNLHVHSNDQFNSQARLGVRVDGQIKNRFSWYGSVAVKQFIGDDYAKLRMDLNLPNTDMKVISAELGRTSFGGQIGANYALTNNWSVFANADAGINNKSANCYGNIGVAYTW
ncbi:MAG: autotransporter outer membrane beta-barrel domain-containing protein, partial [Paludibacteraceae bacterium]|nr:autotransporter outer membrane beta-barrel domain-containing protein [Paludibacteraceae bacterium]